MSAVAENLEYGQPAWITSPLSPYDVAAINQGGCESGAYMPAVSYYQAKETMAEYGDEVLDYIQEVHGELPQPPEDVSWSGLAVFYLSRAVETFAASLEEYANWEDNDPIQIND